MTEHAAWEDGKLYFSYEQIHQNICDHVQAIKDFNPNVILAIGGGGFIPARILRTYLKVPILGVILSLYHEETNEIGKKVSVLQWIDEVVAKNHVAGKRILIVDEVDDTRTTLQFCAEALKEKHSPAAVGVFVLHNKQKPKKGVLTSDVWYCAGHTVSDAWLVYPWDAVDIAEHTRRSYPVK